MKQIITLCLCCILLLCGCSSAAPAQMSTSLPEMVEPETTAAIAPDKTEKTAPVTLTLFVRNFDSTLGGMLGQGSGEDPIMAEIQRQTGVTIQLEESTSELSALETRIASGELCDLTYISAQPAYEDPKIFYPLDVLDEETNAGFFQRTTAMERIANTASDGHIYAVKNRFMAEMVDDCITESVPLIRHDFAPTVMSVSAVDVPFRPLVYRQDVLNTLDVESPSSIEELDALLYQVKDQVETLGITDVFSFVSFFHHPLAEYMGVQQELAYDEEQGKVVYPWRNEAWLDYFKLMRRWHQDGILTLKPGQDIMYNIFGEMETLQTCFMTYPTLRKQNGSINEELRKLNMGGKYGEDNAVFVPFDKALTYENEMQLTLTEYGTGEYGCYIAANSPYADRALQLLTFLKSNEGDRLTRWGVEGIHYEKTPEGLLQYKDMWVDNAQTAAAPNEWGLGRWALMGSAESEAVLRASREINTRDEDLAMDFRLERESCLAVEKAAEYLYNPAMDKAKPVDGSDLAQQARQLEVLFYQYGDLMIQAGSEAEVDKLWNELQDKLAQDGIDAVEAAVTENYAGELKRYHEEGLLTQYSMPK